MEIENLNHKYDFSERQIKILESKRLPREYGQLTTRQKKSIIDIEEMLQSVENKYSRKFNYLGYTAEKPFESGVLTAIPSDSLNIRDRFLVERKGSGFVDTYNLIIARDRFEKQIRAVVNNDIDEGTYKLFSTVLEIKNKDSSEAVLLNDVITDNWLFLDGSKYIDAENTGLFTKIKSVFEKNQVNGSLYIVVVKENCFESISEGNYTDYLTGEGVIQRKFVNI